MSNTLGSKIQVSVSKEHADQVDAVRSAFGGLPVKVTADHWRLSEGDLAMQVTIFLGGAFLGGASWGLLKASIRKLLSQYPKAGISIRDKDSILYTIKPNEEVAVIVVPDRKAEFVQIKTLDDLIELLRSPVSTWTETRLNSLIKNLNAGVSVNSTDRKYAESCSYILKTSSILQGVFNPSEKKIIHEKDKDRASMNPQAGQILISRMNTPKLVGETAYVPRTYPDIFLPDRIWQTEFYSGAEVDTHWLAYLFQSNIYNHKIKSLGTGTSGSMKNISKKDFLSLKLNLPPLPEQKRIVAVLETWDKTIDLLEKKIELKEQLKKGLMQQLLTGKKRLPGFSGKWQVVKLGDIGLFFKGKGISKKELVTDGVPAVRYGELYSKHDIKIRNIYSYITEELAATSVPIEEGDILFAGSGETIDEIGKSAVYLAEDDCYVGGDSIIVRPKEDNPLFLSYLLNSDCTRRFLRKLGQGQSVVHLYKKDLQGLTISMPEKKEQDGIVSILETVDHQVTLLESKCRALKQQKTYLLNNLVTGKIRTPEDMKVIEHA